MTKKNTSTKKLSGIRVVVECAFGRLQARFRCLMKRLDMDHRNVPHVVAACCTLHNIIEERGDPFNARWLGGNAFFDQPQQEIVNDQLNVDANEVRQALMRHLIQNMN